MWINILIKQLGREESKSFIVQVNYCWLVLFQYLKVKIEIPYRDNVKILILIKEF